VRPVERDRRAQQRLERRLVDAILLEEVDRAPLVPGQARVEELPGIGEMRPTMKRELDLVLVGVREGIDPVV